MAEKTKINKTAADNQLQARCSAKRLSAGFRDTGSQEKVIQTGKIRAGVCADPQKYKLTANIKSRPISMCTHADGAPL